MPVSVLNGILCIQQAESDSLFTLYLLYQTIFHINENQASEMARLTMGYPFAFQVLGYLTWNQNGDYKSILPQYEQYLSELGDF